MKMFGRGGEKRGPTGYIDRPNTQTVTEPSRQPQGAAVYEVTNDVRGDSIYEETDVDTAPYQRLGPRDAGNQPVYQELQGNNRPGRSPRNPPNVNYRAGRR